MLLCNRPRLCVPRAVRSTSVPVWLLQSSRQSCSCSFRAGSPAPTAGWRRAPLRVTSAGCTPSTRRTPTGCRRSASPAPSPSHTSGSSSTPAPTSSAAWWCTSSTCWRRRGRGQRVNRSRDLRCSGGHVTMGVSRVRLCLKPSSTGELRLSAHHCHALIVDRLS